MRTRGCRLDGSEPEIKEIKVDEVPIMAQQEHVKLRVTVPLKFLAPDLQRQLVDSPQKALKLADITQEVQTSQWEHNPAEGTSTGYVTVKKGEEDILVASSGHRGIFLQRLARDCLTRGSVTWVPRLDDEGNEEYAKRVRIMAKDASVPLAWRRGAGSDLGIQKDPGAEAQKGFAIWGVPQFLSPDQLKSWLIQQG